eukprot:m.230200 g.230200  ORF g.230200 m.230200 type:complete len:231 (-) comp18857_c0_seq10:395-1087(-)
MPASATLMNTWVTSWMSSKRAAWPTTPSVPCLQIIFHADHGYHLGEHGEWEKKSNFDLVVRVPMLIKVPWKTDTSGGKKTAALTELVDVFPTLASLAGLPAPPGVDGVDIAHLLDDPTGSTFDAAYHQYPACQVKDFNHTRQMCNQSPKQTFDFMGYSMRTKQWRYTAWYPWNQTTLKAEWSAPYAAELYFHDGDDSTNMDEFENENVSESHPSVAKALHARLLAFFQKN